MRFSISETLIISLNKCFSQSPIDCPKINASAGTFEHEYEYGLSQIRRKIETGIGIDVFKKNVLEIGCGQGGICIYAAMNGASQVLGIDLSHSALNTAQVLKIEIERQLGHNLPVDFKLMCAEKLEIQSDEIDIIIADNVFEHVTDLDAVLQECSRVLVKGGRIIVPNFPSYMSKYGPHVKYGIKIPWAHLFFNEKSIVRCLHRIAKSNPIIFHYYPGLKDGAITFRDIREYKDLNYISHKIFKEAIKRSGLKLENVYVTRPSWAWLIMKFFPFLSKTSLDDILSIGTSAKILK